MSVLSDSWQGLKECVTSTGCPQMLRRSINAPGLQRNLYMSDTCQTSASKVHVRIMLPTTLYLKVTGPITRRCHLTGAGNGRECQSKAFQPKKLHKHKVSTNHGFWNPPLVLGLQEAPESWNMDLGRFGLVLLLVQALGLEDSHIPTFWLLLYSQSVGS